MEIPTSFFIAVGGALVVLLVLTYFIRGGVRFNGTLIFVYGFVIGMLTLYIKMKLLG